MPAGNSSISKDIKVASEAVICPRFNSYQQVESPTIAPQTTHDSVTPTLEDERNNPIPSTDGMGEDGQFMGPNKNKNKPFLGLEGPQSRRQ